jgi:hypothetical protein
MRLCDIVLCYVHFVNRGERIVSIERITKAESREQRAESREQKSKSREQRTENREQRAVLTSIGAMST